MNIYVDSREPPSYRRIALTLGFTQMAKDIGDYSSEHCVIERKTIGDLINSIYARYGETGRFWEQIEAMSEFAKEHEVVPFVLIHGNFEKFIAEFKEQGHSLNRNAVYGALASATVRYDVHIIWLELESPEAVVRTIRGILEKIEEGKHLIPQRKKLKEFARDRNLAVIMRTFDLTLKQAEPLQKKFKTLAGVVDAAVHHPSEIYIIENIGARTLRKIQELAGVV